MATRFNAAWWDWPLELRTRDRDALARFAAANGDELERRRVEQWQFDWQWRAIRRYAAERQVHVLGDLPIYVAPDSVSVWSDRHQFQLKEDGRPAEVAGVPPDYFAADGQWWGNPLYDWAQHERDGFYFWRNRLSRQLQRFDLVRIDHFRGLAGYWSIPNGARTAREGRWCPAPGHKLFQVLQQDFPTMPLVAEDLGLITPDVEELRTAFRMPGMRVLQFGFDGSGDNPHLPQNYPRDMVAYTGTHDNDTTAGWYRSLDAQSARRVNFFLRADAANVVEQMERAVLASVAQLAIIPAQDVLRLGSDARLNTPGTASGNWTWRLPADALNAGSAAYYAALNQAFGRAVPEK
jgi:4-alpha-glucanotransferase